MATREEEEGGEVFRPVSPLDWLCLLRKTICQQSFKSTNRNTIIVIIIMTSSVSPLGVTHFASLDFWSFAWPQFFGWLRRQAHRIVLDPCKVAVCIAFCKARLQYARWPPTAYKCSSLASPPRARARIQMARASGLCAGAPRFSLK